MLGVSNRQMPPASTIEGSLLDAEQLPQISRTRRRTPAKSCETTAFGICGSGLSRHLAQRPPTQQRELGTVQPHHLAALVRTQAQFVA